MELEEKIKALNGVADRLMSDYPFRRARLFHRFERWGNSTSRLFLDALQKEGYDLVRKDNE